MSRIGIAMPGSLFKESAMADDDDGILYGDDSCQSFVDTHAEYARRTVLQKVGVVSMLSMLVALSVLVSGPFVTTTLPIAMKCLRDLQTTSDANSSAVFLANISDGDPNLRSNFKEKTKFVLVDENVSNINNTVIWSKPMLGFVSGVLSTKVNPNYLLIPGSYALGLSYFTIPVLLTFDYRSVIVLGFIQGLISGALLPLTIILLYQYSSRGLFCTAIGIGFGLIHIGENLPEAIFAGFCSLEQWSNGFYCVGSLIILLASIWSFVVFCSKRCSTIGLSSPIQENFSMIPNDFSGMSGNLVENMKPVSKTLKFKHTARTTNLIDLFWNYDFYALCLAGFVSFGAAFFFTNYVPRLMSLNSGIRVHDAEWSSKWFLLIGGCFSCVSGPFADWMIRRGSVGICFKLLYSLATLVPATSLLVIVFLPNGLDMTELLIVTSLSMAFVLFYPVAVVATALLWFPEHMKVVSGVLATCLNAGALVLVYFVQWISHEYHVPGRVVVTEAWAWRRITGAAVSFLWVAWSFYLLLDGRNKTT